MPPTTPPQLIGIEYVVPDAEPVLEIFRDRLGFAVLSAGRHPLFDAEQYVLDAGALAVTILVPTATGEGDALVDPPSNPSQMVFAMDDSDEFRDLAVGLAESGLPVHLSSDRTFHLTRQGTQAAFGFAPALVFVRPDEADEAPETAVDLPGDPA